MTRPLPRPSRLAAVALLLGIAGCAAAGATTSDNPFQGGGGGEEQVTIEVENNNFNDATIWALSPSGRHRLGTVSGKSRRSFDLDWTRAQRLSLRIRIQSGRQCETRTLTTDPGDTLRMTIEANFDSSRFCR